jgi:8-oxo-dGTP pyrophosphatase MutT (NUDIX family)
MIKHFTSTIYIIENQKVLLIHHRKLNKWLPPGGHVDPNETPVECALREAKEETGLEIEIISQENIWIERHNARSFERPYMCLLENIPQFLDQPPHQHIDFIYLGKPIGGKISHNILETINIRWFSVSEVEDMVSEEEIFEETKQTVRNLLV